MPELLARLVSQDGLVRTLIPLGLVRPAKLLGQGSLAPPRRPASPGQRG